MMGRRCVGEKGTPVAMEGQGTGNEEEVCFCFVLFLFCFVCFLGEGSETMERVLVN